MEITNILQNAPRKTRATQLAENCNEIDAGLKILGYEEFPIPFENDNPRYERIISFRNENIVLVFYVGYEEVVAMKVFDITKGLTKTTTVFPQLGIRDIPAILKLL